MYFPSPRKTNFIDTSFPLATLFMAINNQHTNLHSSNTCYRVHDPGNIYKQRLICGKCYKWDTGLLYDEKTHLPVASLTECFLQLTN